MDIPSEVMWLVVMLAVLAVAMGVLVFLTWNAGSSRLIDYILGILR